jgi:thiosulfate/3-mercaptopyruvate sulfurtransferase
MASNDLPLIVEPKDLILQLGSDKLLIVDLCSEQMYARGHLPTAVHVSPRELVSGTPPAPGKLPSEDQLNRLFSRLGLGPDVHVVAYDDEGGGWAGRFLWTLDVIGHRRYSYLNGGIWAWRAEGGPLSTDIDQPAPRSVSVLINRQPIMEKEEILKHLGDPDFAIWDARGADEYRGEKVTANKNGHIPGAIHCEWTELMDRDAELRIRADARDYLQAKGLSADKTIVTHCQSHHRSGFTYLVGKSLGLDIKAYPGSWSEWGNDPATPVER